MLRKVESWPDWKIAAVLAVALRIFYSGVAAGLSFFLHPDTALVHSNALTENLPQPGTWRYALIGIWERFDTLWYLRIAQHGYDAARAVIFYPLYPAAIRIVSWVLSATVAALFVSTVAALFFFWGLVRLGREQLGETGKLRMLLVVCLWPSSYVLFAGYAESLTLALIVWAVVFGRAARWWPATVCGMLAGMSRPSGVLVAIPLAVLALRSRRLSSAVVLITPLGLLGYWAWLRATGRLSVVEAYRSYQDVILAPPWAGVREVLRLIITHREGLLAIKFGLVVLVAALSLRREVRIEDKLFAMAVIVQMLMYTGLPLLGAARYLLLVYPAFVVLGRLAEKLNWNRFCLYWMIFAFLNLMWMWGFLNWDIRFV